MLPEQRRAPEPPETTESRRSPPPASEPPDAELLRRHVAGDPDAFGCLFRRHRDRLWAVAVRTLHDPEDAADALQDAMISAFRRASSFRGDSAVTTWLHRIVVNACLDRMRRRAARPEISGGDERLLDVIATASPANSEPTAGSDTSLEVMAALRQLPRDQQMALVLVDMLEYPVSEAAALLGVAEGTVKSRCARGRARLLPKLAHLRHADESGRPGGAAQRRLAGFPANFGQLQWNRLGTGSVLPARDGGDEER
jgi:RNA polymerase sigma-70 factor (ECF subfamily)